jgi:hypothetical protein
MAAAQSGEGVLLAGGQDASGAPQSAILTVSLKR